MCANEGAKLGSTGRSGDTTHTTHVRCSPYFSGNCRADSVAYPQYAPVALLTNIVSRTFPDSLERDADRQFILGCAVAPLI